MSHFLLEHLFFLKFYFMCRGSLPACVYRIRAWCWLSQKRALYPWNFKQLWGTMWVLWIEPGSSERAVSAFNCRTISQSQKTFFHTSDPCLHCFHLVEHSSVDFAGRYVGKQKDHAVMLCWSSWLLPKPVCAFTEGWQMSRAETGQPIMILPPSIYSKVSFHLWNYDESEI